jgi:hypothetical protein
MPQTNQIIKSNMSLNRARDVNMVLRLAAATVFHLHSRQHAIEFSRVLNASDNFLTLGCTDGNIEDALGGFAEKQLECAPSAWKSLRIFMWWQHQERAANIADELLERAQPPAAGARERVALLASADGKQVRPKHSGGLLQRRQHITTRQ